MVYVSKVILVIWQSIKHVTNTYDQQYAIRLKKKKYKVTDFLNKIHKGELTDTTI